METRNFGFILGAFVLAACGAPSESRTTPSSARSAMTSSFEGCRADRIESDLRMTPIEMIALDDVPEGTYFISTTYLALSSDLEAQSDFREAMGNMMRVLPSAPGLVSYRFGTSQSCLTARTVAVWRDQAAMRAFVNSPEHHWAMRRISSISRGDSTFAHWEGGADSAQWDRVAIELARHDGPRL